MRATVGLDEPELSEVEKLPFLVDIAPGSLRPGLSRRSAFGAADLLALYRHLIDTWHGAASGRDRRSGVVLGPAAGIARVVRPPRPGDDQGAHAWTLV
jgi:hypothetical protein